MPDFDGATYQPELDQAHLTRQLDRVRDTMTDGAWWSLKGLAAQCGGTEASISARVRDLRKPKNGGYRVDRQRHPSISGLWLYRLGPPGYYTDSTSRDLMRHTGGEASSYDLGPHRPLRDCPVCHADLAVVGLTSLAYTFEACEPCPAGKAPHLVQQLWHRRCLSSYDRLSQ